MLVLACIVERDKADFEPWRYHSSFGGGGGGLDPAELNLPKTLSVEKRECFAGLSITAARCWRGFWLCCGGCGGTSATSSAATTTTLTKSGSKPAISSVYYNISVQIRCFTHTRLPYLVPLLFAFSVPIILSQYKKY